MWHYARFGKPITKTAFPAHFYGERRVVMGRRWAEYCVLSRFSRPDPAQSSDQGRLIRSLGLRSLFWLRCRPLISSSWDFSAEQQLIAGSARRGWMEMVLSKTTHVSSRTIVQSFSV